MIYISNSYSDNMINWRRYGIVETRTMLYDAKSARAHLLGHGKWHSIIGHFDTAAVLSAELGLELKENRETVSIDPEHDQMLIGQYRGPRLAEGTSTLPEGAEIVWLLKFFDRG